MQDSSDKPVHQRASFFWRYLIGLWIAFTLVSLVAGWVWYKSFAKQELSLQIEQESAMLELHAEQIHKEMLRVVADLNILSSLSVISSPSHTTEEVVDELSKTYVAFMRARGVYDQLRYLDLNGNELVRANRTKSGAIVLEFEHLQNKASRYYFQEIRRLKSGEVYVSRLDLNIENGLVEIPFKPMLRFGVQIYRQNAQGNREEQGVLVINYLAENILHLIEHHNVHKMSSHEFNALSLLDSFGFWLRNPKSSREWGFMFDMPENNLAFENPELWKAMQLKNSGVYFDENGYLVYRFVPATILSVPTGEGGIETVSLISSDQVGKSYGWYLMSQQTSHSLEALALQKIQGNLFLLSLLYGFQLLLVYFVAIFLSSRHYRSQHAHFMANHDSLTGLRSRTAWNESLRYEVIEWLAESKPFAMAFVDLNDFKPINDTHGHNTGDAVLKIVAKRLKNCVRSDDYLIRFGGDEFLVIFKDVFSENIEKELMDKLQIQFLEPVRLMNLQLDLSISVGLVVSPKDGVDIERLLSIADARMYEHKTQQKLNRAK